MYSRSLIAELQLVLCLAHLPDCQDIRNRMAASLLEAVEDGSLEAFLTSGQDLQVQEALQDTTSTALTGLPSDMQYTGIVDMANQTAKSHMAAPRRAAVVQRVVKEYERRTPPTPPPQKNKKKQQRKGQKDDVPTYPVLIRRPAALLAAG